LNIEFVRDEAIRLFKYADVPPERDMDHVQIVGPAIQMLEKLFEHTLEGLPLSD
jgi:hypothetical protein